MDGVVPSQAWRFGHFLLDLPNGGLFRLTEQDGREPVALGGRALDVLATLVARAGELVAKQDLMNAVWPGVAVEEKNLTVQISALRRALDHGRAGESCIQTVPGRGYRLTVAANRVVTAEPAVPSTPPGPLLARQSGRSWRVAALLGLLAVLFIAGSVRIVRRPIHSPAPPRLSLVVLPFGNLGDDAEDARLARSVTEDLTDDLSHVSLINIIAPPSALSDRQTDPRKVGLAAGVRYVLDGSVRRAGDVVRVNARLIAAETGAHLWSERLQLDIGKEGDGEALLVRRLGQAVNVALIDAESARSKRERPLNPDALDLVMQARSLGLHSMGPTEFAARTVLFERAIRIDPGSIMARTQLANELIRRYTYAEGNDLERAATLLREAAALNPNDFGVLEASAFLLVTQGRFAEAIAANRRIIEEFPDKSAAYSDLGICLIYTGRAQEAVPIIQTPIRRDPRSPRVYARYALLGFTFLMLEQDEDAIVWTERALAANPYNHPFSRANLYVRLAGAHARLGQLDLAHRSLAEANRIWPYDTVRMHWPEDPADDVYAAQVARWQSALRAAGHRDHADEDADFGIPSDDGFHSDVVGRTPTSAPGAKLIRTAELKRLLDEAKPIVIDSLLYSWGRSVPGAVGLTFAGMGSGVSDANQERLRRAMQTLTKGNLAAPIVAVGFNSERFDGRNLALRLVALGYTNVLWYRGGRESWEAAGLPETAITAEDW